jgi:hypothetical protein
MQNSTNENRKIAGDLFSRSLKDLLTVKYGYVPSAAKFSDAFNLRAHGTTTISRETARKWIRGEAIPELSRLKVLINWLGLKPSAFLEGEFNAPSIDGAISELNQGSKDENTQSKLISLINQLDHKSIETLFIAAWALKEMRKNPSMNFDYKKYLDGSER